MSTMAGFGQSQDSQSSEERLISSRTVSQSSPGHLPSVDSVNSSKLSQFFTAFSNSNTISDLTSNASPLALSPASHWICTRCHHEFNFTETSSTRPLGTLDCFYCGWYADNTVRIVDVPNIARVSDTLFTISLPIGMTGPPKTKIGDVCCQCGTSHVREPKELERAKGPDDKVKLGVRKTLLGAAKKYKSLFSHLKGHTKVPGLETIPARRIVHAGIAEGREERKAFTVGFRGQICGEDGCEHESCGECFRFKVVAEGEWVAETGNVPGVWTDLDE